MASRRSASSFAKKLSGSAAMIPCNRARYQALAWSGSAYVVGVHGYQGGSVPGALGWSVRAGVEAEGSYAYAGACNHYGGGLGLWARIPQAGTRAGIDRVGVLRRAAGAANSTCQSPIPMPAPCWINWSAHVF